MVNFISFGISGQIESQNLFFDALVPYLINGCPTLTFVLYFLMAKERAQTEFFNFSVIFNCRFCHFIFIKLVPLNSKHFREFDQKEYGCDWRPKHKNSLNSRL